MAPSAIDNAMKCFVENRDLFGEPPGARAEQFNLYQGLANLAEAVREIQVKQTELERQLQAKVS